MQPMRMIRHIAPYILLAAYMPLLVTLSFHTHTDEHSADFECVECLHHIHHKAHLAESVSMAHDCVYCQLASTSYIGSESFVLSGRNDQIARVYEDVADGYDATLCELSNPRAPPLQ